MLDDIAQAPHGPAAAPLAPGPLPADEEASRLARGDAFAWRLSIAAATAALGDVAGQGFMEERAGPDGERGWIPLRPAIAGDVALARKDLGVSYHLAVVVDDADQGVSHVIRGHDLFEAAHVQTLLQALLGLPRPAYRHHPLILRPDGKRFAKRDTAETLASLRAAGVSPEALRAELGV